MSHATRPRHVRRNIHGVLLLDKPVGMSSNDALQKAKHLFRAEKAGHTGTLDPLADGLLPLCFGAATKFSQVSLEADKTYRATLTLGVTTTTGDAEGAIVKVRPVHVSCAQWPEVLAGFLGDIAQVPPMYSALKHEGKPLYSYARAGIEIHREARQIHIRSLSLISGEGAEWTIEVNCSKGTYIRTLAQDIGESLGCGAHLKALRRLKSGPLSVDHALTLHTLEALSEDERTAFLHPPDKLLADCPVWRLEGNEANRFIHGMRRRVAAPDAAQVRVYGPQRHAFLGSAQILNGELIPTRLLSLVEMQSTLNHASPPFAVLIPS